MSALRCLHCKTLVKCAACQIGYEKSYWSASELKMQKARGTVLVCKDCRSKGCTPHDTHMYKCTTCAREMGSARFDVVSFQHFRDHGRRTLTCKDCVKDCKKHIKCAACQTSYEKSYLSSSERNNLQKQGTLLVCKDCRSKGCTPHDTHMYKCTTCAREMGSARFDVVSFQHFRDHGRRTLTCKDCKTARAEREKRLRLQLRGSKRVCKCFCPFHKDMCPLTPCIYGERRWPGSDGHISEAERNFLDALHPVPAWWAKAWGSPALD